MVEIIRFELYPNTTNFNFENKSKNCTSNPSWYWKVLFTLAIIQVFVNMLQFADAATVTANSPARSRFPRHFPVEPLNKGLEIESATSANEPLQEKSSIQKGRAYFSYFIF